jgi:hypothetical protein
MHVLINVKSPNNISEWHMGFNSAFKGLIQIKYNIFLYMETATSFREKKK